MGVPREVLWGPLGAPRGSLGSLWGAPELGCVREKPTGPTLEELQRPFGEDISAFLCVFEERPRRPGSAGLRLYEPRFYVWSY